MLLSWQLWLVGALAAGVLLFMSTTARWLDRLPTSLSLVIMALPMCVGLALSIWIQERIIDRCIREESPHTCPHCGYDLTANVSGLCPECGTAIPLHDSRLFDEPR